MKKILIVGGYGAVGMIISKHLAALYPNKVIVAGRNLEMAVQLSQQLNHTIIPRKLDILGNYDPAILADVGLVIMCIDQSDTSFADLCISKGINYIDITANQVFIEKTECLDTKAKAHDVSVILSVGLAPGLTNLLAQHNIRQLPQSKWTDIFILLGLGEKHGDAAYRWTFDNLHKEYAIAAGTETRKLKSFTAPKSTTLSGKRNFYLFNFPDQHTLVRTTPVKNVLTRLAFDSRLLTESIAWLRKTGLTRIFNNKKIRDLLIPLFKKAVIGSDIFAVKAETGNGIQTYVSGIKGYGEGKVTAYVAIQTALIILQNVPRKGVVHLHEIVDNIPDFLLGLKAYDATIEIDLS